jgi:hypothetical protein
MTEITDFERSEKINTAAVNPQKFNLMWGNDFLLMDSNTFMGGTEGSEYEKIIEIFVNIWNSNNFKIFKCFL